MSDLVYRLRKRAKIRRNIPNRKSVQEGASDRIADLLDEAADNIEKLEAELFDKLEHERDRNKRLAKALEFYAERKVMEFANQFLGDDELIDVSHIAKTALEENEK